MFISIPHELFYTISLFLYRMPIPDDPTSHPESVLELLQWMVTVRTIHERRGFLYLPEHDDIVLSLLDRSTTLQWSRQCQLQFNTINNVLNISFTRGRGGSVEIAPMPSAVHVARTTDLQELHQPDLAPPEDPSRPRRHGPMRRHRSNGLLGTAPRQLTLLHSSLPYQLQHARTCSSSILRQPGGPDPPLLCSSSPPNARSAVPPWAQATTSTPRPVATGGTSTLTPTSNGSSGEHDEIRFNAGFDTDCSGDIMIVEFQSPRGSDGRRGDEGLSITVVGQPFRGTRDASIEDLIGHERRCVQPY